MSIQNIRIDISHYFISERFTVRKVYVVYFTVLMGQQVRLHNYNASALVDFVVIFIFAVCLVLQVKNGCTVKIVK